MGSPVGRHGHAGVPRAPGEERSELGLEAVRLPGGVLHGGQRRVDGAVEHHGPHVGREELGVGGAEECAVGVAHEGQPGVAEGGPDPVEVPGGIDGAHVGEDAAAVVLALGGVLLVVAEQGLLRGRGGRDRVDELAGGDGPPGARPATVAAQSTGLLRPTPLGSNETMSNRSSSPG